MRVTIPLAKIQRSLYSSSSPALLVYDKEHTYLVFCPLTDEHKNWFKKDEWKFFGSVEVCDDPVSIKILSKTGDAHAYDW